MNLLKTLATVSGMTLLSRILGFVRDFVIARTFGAGMLTDAFFVAFKLPNLLRRLFAEGAFSQAFVPVLGEYRNRRGEAETKTFVDHVAHMAGLVGAEHVGIALDYAFDADKVDDLVEGNGAYWPESAGYGRHPTSYVPPKQLREITETMVRRGFKDREILGILGGNFMRVASAVWK